MRKALEAIIGSRHSGEWIYPRPKGGLTGPEGVGIQRHTATKR